MGTYTTFTFDATLSKDAPGDVVAFVRQCLTRSTGEELRALPPDSIKHHRFFKCYRWAFVLTWANCNGNGFKAWCKDTDEGLVIHIDTMLKNYCEAVDWFLVWVAPFVNLELPCGATFYTEGWESTVTLSSAECQGLLRYLMAHPSQEDKRLDLVFGESVLC